jgi:uncharacterized membrane protein
VVSDPFETVESSGPIQLLVIAFPGSRFKGEILPQFDRLKQEGIVRILDMLLVRKDAAGNVLSATATDLDWDEATALGAYLGALTGYVEGGREGVDCVADGHIFDDYDIFRVTRALPDDMTAALLLIEHTWAKPLLDAVSSADGVELLNEWVRPEAVLSIEPSFPQTFPQRD